MYICCTVWCLTASKRPDFPFVVVSCCLSITVSILYRISINKWGLIISYVHVIVSCSIQHYIRSSTNWTWPILATHMSTFTSVFQDLSSCDWLKVAASLNGAVGVVHPVSVVCARSWVKRHENGPNCRCPCFCEVAVVCAAVLKLWWKGVGAQLCDMRLTGKAAQHQTRRAPAFTRRQIRLRWDRCWRFTQTLLALRFARRVVVASVLASIQPRCEASCIFA